MFFVRSFSGCFNFASDDPKTQMFFPSFDDFYADFLPLYRLKMGFVRRRSFTAAPVLIINCFASFVLIKNPGFALKIASLERDVVRREFYRENPIRFVLFARSIVRKWGRRRSYEDRL